MSKVRDLPEVTELDDADLLYVVDASAGTNGGRKIQKQNLKATAEAHHISHRPGGTDALDTAAPIDINADGNNDIGIATSFSKSDHKHDVAVNVPVTQTPDQTNAEGVSSYLARADHIHNIPAAAPVSSNANGSNDKGVAATFSLSDHKHNITTAAASTQTPDQANASGSSSSLARADHVHNIPSAAPSSTGTANTQGSAASFALSDHVHNTVISSTSATATADDTTTSATDTLMVSMTITPASGTYLAMWSGSISNSANGAERTFISLYLDGTQVTATERSIGTSGGAYVPSSVSSVVSANGSQAVELRWRVAGGTSTVRSRRLTLIRLG